MICCMYIKRKYLCSSIVQQYCRSCLCDPSRYLQSRNWNRHVSVPCEATEFLVTCRFLFLLLNIPIFASHIPFLLFTLFSLHHNYNLVVLHIMYTMYVVFCHLLLELNNRNSICMYLTLSDIAWYLCILFSD